MKRVVFLLAHVRSGEASRAFPKQKGSEKTSTGKDIVEI
jgi:hypothetical protein